MGSSLPSAAVSSVDGYRVWARSYDTDPNPMLSLEKRFLENLLPNVRGLDVVDFGCGTGRWLSSLQENHPRSLLGVDSSPEMLEVAKCKLGSSAPLICSDCIALDLPKDSADLILCSFLLSYIEDSSVFLKQISRTLRTNGSVFITDLHPETVERFQWRRTVRLGAGFQELRTSPRTLDLIVQQCEKANLEVKICLQVPFGKPEISIFRSAGKEAYFDQVKDYPAIYILQLQSRKEENQTQPGSAEFIETINGARLGLGPECSASCDLTIRDSRISFLNKHQDPLEPKEPSSSIDLCDYLVLPGLINSHDHLEFALYPRLGTGSYKNFMEWVDDIHHPDCSPILEHRKVSRETRLWWGGIRNLLSGVTTVCHHNPYEESVFDQDFVIRVVRDFGWAHSLSLDADVAEKKRASQGQPFLIHLGEGIDDCSAQEIFELHKSGALDEETILIHALALNAEGRALVRSTGAGVIWCPSSNAFLFGKTLSPEEIQDFPAVSLGSDSPLTGVGDLLDEICFARGLGDIRANDLFNYVTRNASQLLRLQNGEGTLRVGSSADLIAVRDDGNNPADALTNLSHKNLELVLIGGRVQLASEQMMNLLPPDLAQGLQPICVESSLRWIRAPLDRLFAETRTHLGDEIRLGGKRITLGN